MISMVAITPNPPSLHLGDLVNIIQRHHRRAKIISCPVNCPCHNNDVYTVSSCILSFLQSEMKAVRDTIDGAIPVDTDWTQSGKPVQIWNRRLYERPPAKPKQQNYIACQFDARTNTPWKKTVEPETVSLISNINETIYNIGDKSHPGLVDKTKLVLADKFEIISSARAYIGIDSGLTHMALMSHCPVIVILHRSQIKPWYFYPDDPRIVFIDADSKVDLSALKQPA